MSKRRREEIEDIKVRYEYKNHLEKYSDKPLKDIIEIHEDEPYFGADLPF